MMRIRSCIWYHTDKVCDVGGDGEMRVTVQEVENTWFRGEQACSPYNDPRITGLTRLTWTTDLLLL
jgi:hypothetical protein